MEEVCGGGQGLSWAVEPKREREREKIIDKKNLSTLKNAIPNTTSPPQTPLGLFCH
jgi:hypothetical protein